MHCISSSNEWPATHFLTTTHASGSMKKSLIKQDDKPFYGATKSGNKTGQQNSATKSDNNENGG